MKSSLALIAAACFAASTAWADWVIESQIESPQMNSKTTIKIKGDKMRADIASGPMGAMSSIMDSASGESIQLIHAQKMAMKTTAAQMKAAMEMAKKSAGPQAGGPAAKLQSTGQTEKVGEYDCEIWSWTDGSVTSKYWVAKKHPQAEALKEIDKKMRSGALGSMSGGPDTSVLPGPVMRTETSTNGMTMKTTVLSIKEAAVDAKEFEVPADYQALTMPALPNAPK